jgi:hypothetical protein
VSIEEDGKAFIEHYGVKGMRWGVRRTDAELARSRKKKESDSDSSSKGDGKKNSRGNIGKSSANLSDKELKDVVSRMQLEKQYASLKPKSISQVAVDTAKSIVAQAARSSVQQLANQAFNQQMNSVMKSLQYPSSVPSPPNRFPSAAPNPKDRVG